MNERLKALCEQAISEVWESRKGADDLVRTDGNPYIFYEKFAELIVRECIEKSLEEQIDPDLIDQEQDIEDRCYSRGSNSGIITAVCAIKQHFGVES